MANPNGKKGSDAHQEVQEEEFYKLLLEYDDFPNIDVEMEVAIATPKGIKKFRLADAVAYEVMANWIKYHKIIQVGKTDKNGEPIKREKEVIKDFEQHTGTKVTFVGYIKRKLGKNGKSS